MTGTATFGEPAGQLLFAQLTFCWTLFRVFETHADAVKPSLPDPDLAMAAPSPIRALPHIPAQPPALAHRTIAGYSRSRRARLCRGLVNRDIP